MKTLHCRAYGALPNIPLDQQQFLIWAFPCLESQVVVCPNISESSSLKLWLTFANCQEWQQKIVCPCLKTKQKDPKLILAHGILPFSAVDFKHGCVWGFLVLANVKKVSKLQSTRSFAIYGWGPGRRPLPCVAKGSKPSASISWAWIRVRHGLASPIYGRVL